MKILFSNPPWWEHSDDGSLRTGIRAGSRWPFTRGAVHAPDQFRFGGYLPFPFFLAHAASYTQQLLPGAQVWMRDSIARGESYESFARHLRTSKPDWLVIETATPSWPHDSRWLKALAIEMPECRVIITGTLDCARAAEVMRDLPNVAAIVQGEYDKQIAAVVNDGKRGLIPHNLLTRDEMNAAPAPMFDEVAALNYWDACPRGQSAPQLQAWTSRGCPFSCVFCVWPAVMTGNDPDGTKPRKVRLQDPAVFARHLRERLEIAEKRGVPYQSIYLDDDTFNLSQKHTLAMCEVMKEIGLPWSAMCRADTIDRATWQAMKDAGCFGVKLGFESGSQWVIDNIVNKKLNLAEAADTARFLRSIGMTVHGTFTIGLPGETHEQQEETKAFIRMLYETGGLDTHQLSGTAEIEGTPLHTLRTSGHLDKYAGAKIDDGYIVSPDGQRKIEAMTKPLLT
jgi:radical SAM superfamily enzyme YgiQ (UPF0313 family)